MWLGCDLPVEPNKPPRPEEVASPWGAVAAPGPLSHFLSQPPAASADVGDPSACPFSSHRTVQMENLRPRPGQSAEQLGTRHSCVIAPAPGSWSFMFTEHCVFSHIWSSRKARAGWVKTGSLGSPAVAPSAFKYAESHKVVKRGRQ